MWLTKIGLILSMYIQVRPLRLRFQKEDEIKKAKFYITSLQDDQSEIALSSGNISLDLMHRREHFEANGIIIAEPFLKRTYSEIKFLRLVLLGNEDATVI